MVRALEPRRLSSGAAAGRPYHDREGNGVSDVRETPPATRQLRADLDRVGDVDADEPTTLTGGNGRYRLRVEATGEARIVRAALTAAGSATRRYYNSQGHGSSVPVDAQTVTASLHLCAAPTSPGRRLLGR